MNLGSSPPLDDLVPAEAWQEIEAVLEELARLARSQMPVAAFHSRLLERLTGVLAAVGGVIWSLGQNRRTTAECQLHLDQSLAGDAQEFARHQRAAEAIAAAG